MGVGTVIAAAGALYAYQSQNDAARRAERLGRMQAAEAKRAAEYQLYVQRKQTEKLLSKQRAAYAKAGVTAEGTPMLVLAETADDAAREAAEIRRRGYATADAYMMDAKNKSKTLQAGAFGSLITGASNVYSAGVDDGLWGNASTD